MIFSNEASGDERLSFLKGDGEMRARIRAFDWASTELGDAKYWPSSIKAIVGTMLSCAKPAYIALGPSFIQLYNDAYIPILGHFKHPHALGLSTAETWHEIWNLVGPLFKDVIEFGRAISMENKLLPMLRNGYLEECYFTFSYSPAITENGTVFGVFVTPWETTLDFIGKRQDQAIQFLIQGISEAKNAHEICLAFEKLICNFSQDIPFALWYEKQQDQTCFSLVAAGGIKSETQLSPKTLSKSDSFYKKLINFDTPEIISSQIDSELLQDALTHPFITKPTHLLIKPLCYTNYQHPDGYLVFAVNPMRPNNETQKKFFQTIRVNIENAIRRVNRQELERREREHQFQAILTALPCLVWIADVTKARFFFNQTWLKFSGRALEEEIGDGWVEGIHPDDRDVVRQYREYFDRRAPFVMEYRLRHAEGTYRWVIDEAMPHYDMCGQFLGYIGTCLDITERKESEQSALSSQSEMRLLYFELKNVRDEERRALAREVHDQLGQILSAAKIDIKLLEEEIQSPKGRFSRKKTVAELKSASLSIDKAIEVVRRLAFELRPPELTSQGLQATLCWHVEDFERRTKISCRMVLPQKPLHLSDSGSGALFGIFQEAMTNILRHAKASRVWISVKQGRHCVYLRVRDNGVGINSEAARKMASIGLRGMRERAENIGGKVKVKRLQASGTSVMAKVPQDEQDATHLLIMNPANLASGDTA